MKIFADALFDAVNDSLKVLPILFLAYLLVSFLSHDHSHKFSHFLSRHKNKGPLYGAFLGCVPQCGFSSVISDLYAHHDVTLGTLIAVFVATSDEAIPIMLSYPDKIVDLLVLTGVKLVLAVAWGYLVDLSIFALQKSKLSKKSKLETNDIQPQHEEHLHNHIHECGHIHTDYCEDDCQHGDCCVNNVFIDAFLHTFSVLIYIFVATFALNLVIGYCGTEVLENFLTTNPYLQVVIASLVGLIPNCASSVLLVELYIFGTLCFPALLAGLTAGAGVGVVILWTRNKKYPLKNFGVLFLQYLIGVTSGMLCIAIMLLCKIPL